MEEKIRVKHEGEIRGLIEKEKVATERLEEMIRWRQEAEMEYFQKTGYGRMGMARTERKGREERIVGGFVVNLEGGEGEEKNVSPNTEALEQELIN